MVTLSRSALIAGMVASSGTGESATKLALLLVACRNCERTIHRRKETLLLACSKDVVLRGLQLKFRDAGRKWNRWAIGHLPDGTHTCSRVFVRFVSVFQ